MGVCIHSQGTGTKRIIHKTAERLDKFLHGVVSMCLFMGFESIGISLKSVGKERVRGAEFLGDRKIEKAVKPLKGIWKKFAQGERQNQKDGAKGLPLLRRLRCGLESWAGKERYFQQAASVCMLPILTASVGSCRSGKQKPVFMVCEMATAVLGVIAVVRYRPSSSLEEADYRYALVCCGYVCL